MLHRHRKPLYRSEYFSRHKLKMMPMTNLAEPGNIDAAFDARVYKNETILACFMGDPCALHVSPSARRFAPQLASPQPQQISVYVSAGSIRWMVHFSRMLQALGFDHFMALAHDENACTKFRRAWCTGDFASEDPDACKGKDLGALLFPGCAWLDPRAPRAQMGRDHAVWNETQRMDEVMRLWLLRYFIASEALKRGVNVLMADTDGARHPSPLLAQCPPPRAVALCYDL